MYIFVLQFSFLVIIFLRLLQRKGQITFLTSYQLVGLASSIYTWPAICYLESDVPKGPLIISKLLTEFLKLCTLC